MSYTMGSLFSGIGGFDRGFERAGFRTVWQIEINPYCLKVLAKRFPEAKRYADIRDCGTFNLVPVDVICGGDPCQRNSNAWRNGTGAESTASDFIRIVEQLRPRIVLRENPSVVRKDAPWPWWRFRMGLERLGYSVLPFRLRSCCTGADHRRERLYLLAELPDANRARLEGDERKELEGENERRQDTDAGRSTRRSPAPRICRRADGIPSRMDRLKSLGNAIDPNVAEMLAWRIRRAMEAS